MRVPESEKMMKVQDPRQWLMKWCTVNRAIILAITLFVLWETLPFFSPKSLW